MATSDDERALDRGMRVVLAVVPLLASSVGAGIVHAINQRGFERDITAHPVLVSAAGWLALMAYAALARALGGIRGAPRCILASSLIVTAMLAVLAYGAIEYNVVTSHHVGPNDALFEPLLGAVSLATVVAMMLLPERAGRVALRRGLRRAAHGAVVVVFVVTVAAGVRAFRHPWSDAYLASLRALAVADALPAWSPGRPHVAQHLAVPTLGVEVERVDCQVSVARAGRRVRPGTIPDARSMLCGPLAVAHEPSLDAVLLVERGLNEGRYTAIAFVGPELSPRDLDASDLSGVLAPPRIWVGSAAAGLMAASASLVRRARRRRAELARIAAMEHPPDMGYREAAALSAPAEVLASLRRDLAESERLHLLLALAALSLTAMPLFVAALAGLVFLWG